ncbi:MAG TPA: hypothetical protein VLA48_10360 [Nitrososphaeraceae archaeon]|nr:hypothetical protein [Nitrososphaeraceae archaeon]
MAICHISSSNINSAGDAVVDILESNYLSLLSAKYSSTFFDL